jgi:hypothetical protein
MVRAWETVRSVESVIVSADCTQPERDRLPEKLPASHAMQDGGVRLLMTLVDEQSIPGGASEWREHERKRLAGELPDPVPGVRDVVGERDGVPVRWLERDAGRDRYGFPVEMRDGAWMPTGEVLVAEAGSDVWRPATKREKRRCSIEPHLERIRELNLWGIEFEVPVDPPDERGNRVGRWATLRQTYLLSPVRSRRGRKRRVDHAQVRDAQKDGAPLLDASVQLGVKRQSIYNRHSRDRLGPP